MLKSKNILFLMSGSIACYKACDLLSQLVKQGANVQCVTSDSALKFIGTATLEGLTGNQVMTTSFTEGQMMSHIDLCKWADLALLVPATAKTINRIHYGIGEGLISDLALAWNYKEKPFVIAPAMNTQMYNSPQVQESLNKLKSWGINILPTNHGTLACGDVGYGKLLEPLEIIDSLKTIDLKQKAAKARVLITYGGTSVAIDQVRRIVNTSSGQTGNTLTQIFSKQNYEVHTLKSTQSLSSGHSFNETLYNEFNDFEKKLNHLLQSNSYDIVIHLAAVSDFYVDKIFIKDKEYAFGENTKLPSTDELSIHFKKNKKLIKNIKSLSKNKKVQLVGFKLTSSLDQAVQKEAIEEIIAETPVDLLIHNDINSIDNSKKLHKFTAYQLTTNTSTELSDAQELGKYLIKYCEQIKTPHSHNQNNIDHKGAVL